MEVGRMLVPIIQIAGNITKTNAIIIQDIATGIGESTDVLDHKKMIT
jgi:hypothetical protein